jgi:hypothetical protein
VAGAYCFAAALAPLRGAAGEGAVAQGSATSPPARILVNDDRVGRALEKLFHADRGSLLTRLVLNAVRAYTLDLSQFHNDSTTITFAGANRNADGRAKSGRTALAIKHGQNKNEMDDQAFASLLHCPIRPFTSPNFAECARRPREVISCASEPR